MRYEDLEVVSHWVQTRELLIRNFRWVGWPAALLSDNHACGVCGRGW